MDEYKLIFAAEIWLGGVSPHQNGRPGGVCLKSFECEKFRAYLTYGEF
jgi:hypothetical protein